MNSFLVKMWFGTMLTLLSSLVPTWLLRENLSHIKAHAFISIQIPAPSASLVLHREKLVPVNMEAYVAAEPSVLCHLDGQTIYQGMPYGNAEIDFWITSPSHQEMRHIRTNADGTYHVTLNMTAKTNEPLDWELKAQKDDFKTLHRTGRRIVRYDDSNVTIHNVLEFIDD